MGGLAQRLPFAGAATHKTQHAGTYKIRCAKTLDRSEQLACLQNRARRTTWLVVGYPIPNHANASRNERQHGQQRGSRRPSGRAARRLRGSVCRNVRPRRWHHLELNNGPAKSAACWGWARASFRETLFFMHSTVLRAPAFVVDDYLLQTRGRW